MFFLVLIWIFKNQRETRKLSWTRHSSFSGTRISSDWRFNPIDGALRKCFRTVKRINNFLRTKKQVEGFSFVSVSRKKTYFVDLFVRVSNKRAVDMYHKLNYVVYRRILGYYSGERDEDAFGKFPFRKTFGGSCWFENSHVLNFFEECTNNEQERTISVRKLLIDEWRHKANRTLLTVERWL